MGKLVKLLISLFVLAGVVLIGLTLFVRFYLTDERVKSLVIPQAEKALGRDVHIGNVSVGLFSGISIQDFSVKESDGRTDFISAKKFILNYKLWPLLSKNLVVSQVLLEEPQIRIIRDKTGKFNFDNLSFMANPQQVQEAASEKTAGNKTAAAAIPLALTVKKVLIKNARVHLKDDTGKIPDTDAEADLNLSLDIGKNLASMRYKGDITFSADAAYGKISPHISGKSEFDQDRLAYSIDVKIDDQQVNLAGEVKNYTRIPDIRLDIASKALDIDKLAGILAKLPSTTEKGGRSAESASASKAASVAPAASLPEGLKASGSIKIIKALYNDLEIKDFSMRYSLNNGIFTMEDLMANTAGGQISSRMQADLTRTDLSYEGEMAVKSLMLERLLPHVSDISSDMVSGALESHITFSGAGTQWPALRDALSADGNYAIRNGKVQDTPVTRVVAKLLGIKEINNLKFDSLDGTLHLSKGKLALKSKMSGKDVRAEAEGTVGLDGRLDMPVRLLLSPELSKKFRSRASIAKYLTVENGWTSVDLKIAGTVKRPRPALDAKAVKKQIKKKVREKALEAIKKIYPRKKDNTTEQKGEEPAAGAAEELIKGLFGQ